MSSSSGSGGGGGKVTASSSSSAPRVFLRPQVGRVEADTPYYEVFDDSDYIDTLIPSTDIFVRDITGHMRVGDVRLFNGCSSVLEINPDSYNRRDDGSFSVPIMGTGMVATSLSNNDAVTNGEVVRILCPNTGSFLCPVCLKNNVRRFFCSQECFKRSYKQHKKIHQNYPSNPAREGKPPDDNSFMLPDGGAYTGAVILAPMSTSSETYCMPHGKGKVVYYTAGDGVHGRECYDGQWENGQLVAGRIVKGDPDEPGCQIYTGGIACNVPHGIGKQLYANGDVFVGEWIHGKRVRGEMRTPSQHVFRGIYHQNWMIKGSESWPIATTTSIFTNKKKATAGGGGGEAERDEEEEQGKITETGATLEAKGLAAVANFTKRNQVETEEGIRFELPIAMGYYEGEYAEGARHGTGLLIDEQGRYKGCFNDGSKHGCGTQYRKNGKIWIGVWKHNRCVAHKEFAEMPTGDKFYEAIDWAIECASMLDDESKVWEEVKEEEEEEEEAT